MTREQVLARNMVDLLPPDPQPFNREGYDGYRQALECAGVLVLAKEEFGSYQGEWWAQVQLPSGQVVFVTGYYGSCSACDAFEGEFGWGADDRADYPARLQAFGRDYLEQCYTRDDAIKKASEHLEWDSDAAKAVAWLSALPQPPEVTP